MIKGYQGIEPKIDETAFIAEGVDVWISVKSR